MKRLFPVLSGAAALCGCAVFALSARAYPAPSSDSRFAEPSPQVSDIRSSVDSVPQTAIVPVQQAPVRLVEHTNVYEVSGEGLNRVERRALRAKNYAACIDSLVQSHNYMFYPATMQEMPDGRVRSIYADSFRRSCRGAFARRPCCIAVFRAAQLRFDVHQQLSGFARAVRLDDFVQHRRWRHALPCLLYRLDRYR